MSDDFLPTTPPLVAPKTARGVARAYIDLADSLSEATMVEEATAALRSSNWWLTYAMALSQNKASDG